MNAISLNAVLLKIINMNEIVSKFLLSGDKLMPEMYLNHPGFTKYIYRNKLDKACFWHMAYGDFKDLTRRTDSDKFLRDKAFYIVKIPKYNGY